MYCLECRKLATPEQKAACETCSPSNKINNKPQQHKAQLEEIDEEEVFNAIKEWEERAEYEYIINTRIL